MKLLTTGGLLYSTVQAQNADGTRGTYQSFDYVAMFPEGTNGGLNLATATAVSAGPVNVGWDPMVTEVISNWDGGKTIAGFGKVTGTVYHSWVIKMWGASGLNTQCANNATITGYVRMALGLNADLKLSANCTLTSDAKVQWAWTSLPTAGITEATTKNTYSFIVNAATEEWVNGGSASGIGADPYIIVVGGSTQLIKTSFGLGAWDFDSAFITYAGVTQTAAPKQSTSSTYSGEVVALDSKGLAWADAALTTSSKLILHFVTNSCWTAVKGDPSANGGLKMVVAGGFVWGINTCLQHAVDGYSFWGSVFVARTGLNWAAVGLTEKNSFKWVTTYGILKSTIGTSGKSITKTGQNTCAVRVIRLNYKSGQYQAFILLTSAEHYHASAVWTTSILSTSDQIVPKANAVAFTHTTYGSVWNFWPFQLTNTSAAKKAYYLQDVDNIVMVGTFKGKGTMFRCLLATATADLKKVASFTKTVFTVNASSTTGLLTVASPTGGMGQFKGLTYSTIEATYVKVLCLGVAPMYYTTAFVTASTDTATGWVVSCYTGIPQCESSLVDYYTPLIATVQASCLNDPRYMTWRVMTMRIEKIGTISWWRTDSYWDSSSTMFSSTWGTGVQLSVSLTSNDDNNQTNVGKTFLFAYGDGSGIQLNHIAFGTSPASTNSTASAGTNSLTTAPTTFTNTSPKLLNQNYCLSSNLELTGTTDVSALASAITEWSDGYKVKLSLNLEMLLAGAAGGWRGVCMVYYSSQYVMDNTNGSICYAAQVDKSTGKGPTDFGAGYLMHVGSAIWQPPSMTASLTPSSAALTGGKYSIVYAPTAAAAYIYTQGYYSSVTYYQPKYASSYEGVARYGKDDYVGAYCMQGSGSNSYFSSTAASVKLTGAMYLTAGVVSLGTVLSLAI